MALDFALGTTDRVEHGSAASLDDVVPITILLWVNPDTIDTAYRRLLSKRADATHETSMNISDEFDSSNLNGFTFTKTYATTDAVATAVQNTMTTGAWQFLGATFDGSTAPKLFRGTETALVAEVSYFTSVAPVGALNSDAAANMTIGSQPGGSTVVVMDGRIAWIGIWNATFTLAQIQQQQFRPRKTDACVLFTHYGIVGTGTQPDWSGSGNTGTVTGATVAAHPGMRALFGIPKRRAYVVAVGPTPLVGALAIAGVAGRNDRGLITRTAIRGS